MNQCPYDYKVRLPHEPEMKLCTTCKRRMPITAFRYRVKYFNSGVAKWYRYAQCHECTIMKRRQRVMRQQRIKNAEKAEMEAGLLTGSIKTCKTHCKLYPCFAGIDTIRTNLALTCIHYEPTEHQDTAE